MRSAGRGGDKAGELARDAVGVEDDGEATHGPISSIEANAAARRG